MTEFSITYRGVVYPWHCDHIGHMNLMWNAGKFDEACWQAVSMLGLTPSRLRNEGAALGAAEQHTEYKRDLHAGDAITIRTAILQFGEKSVHLSHEMQIDKTHEIAATCTIVGIYFDADSRRPQAFPLDVRELRRIKVYDPLVASPFSDTCNSGYLAELKDHTGGWELSRS